MAGPSAPTERPELVLAGYWRGAFDDDRFGLRVIACSFDSEPMGAKPKPVIGNRRASNLHAIQVHHSLRIRIHG